MEKKLYLRIPEADIIKPGDFSILISGLSRVDLLLVTSTSKHISFAEPYSKFLSDKPGRSTLEFLLPIVFERSCFNLNSLPVSQFVNKLLRNARGIVI